uniref:BESS domain-containing protein n=1 Tax=Oncorhynchus kisutch TaxID=8019 RepID=A0A8C7CC98_ONCKI
MDEKLILSVFNFPELYNTTLPDYRNGETRSLAWRRISALTALPGKLWSNLSELASFKQSDLFFEMGQCKRKWKNLRDRYFKEVRQEKRSKEETGERTTSRWKYRQLLNFLQPFIKPRNGNADHDNQEKSPASPCSSSTPAKLSTKNRRLLAKEKDHRSDSMIPNRQCDEDEMFLLSFVPALKRLAPQKRCETKIKIQQIMYEAEFSDIPVNIIQ